MGVIGISTRRTLIDSKEIAISQRVQCELLGLHRSGLYYEPRGPKEEDLLLMRAIDEQYLKTPFYGRRRMALAMQDVGLLVGQKKVRTAMQTMGLEVIYPKPNLSKGDQAHKKYPYLMRGIEVDRVDQAWAADITYIPLPHGFGYLFAIMDWFSRYVIAWDLSNLLDAHFCITTLKKSLEKNRPEIFNTDQGVQFTCREFTGHLEHNGVKISMDGKGRALDNVFVERLWRSVKYEEIYPKGHENLKEVRKGLDSYFEFYNGKRRHQGLGYRTPAEVYFGK